MKKQAIIVGGCLLAGAAFGSTVDVGFEPYDIILTRKPFGEAPPVEVVQPPVVVNPADSFANGMRLTALVVLDDGKVQAGFFDTKGNKDFSLLVGENQEGIELFSADVTKEEAVLKKGTEMARLSMSETENQPISQADLNKLTASAANNPNLSYLERQRLRQAERQAILQQPPPEPPKLTGEALQKHLEEYQMEVIRNGLPPLPIPLTDAMDKQLVSEGVLPSQDAPAPTEQPAAAAAEPIVEQPAGEQPSVASQ